MGFFDMFGGQAMEEGLERYKKTPGAVLLDVREPDEYAQGHIPGSINLPLGRISQIGYPIGTCLFVYCLSGARSAQARRRLEGSGYGVTDLGGISSYHGALERG